MKDFVQDEDYIRQGILKGGSITVPLTSCLTGLELVVCQQTIFVFICKTDLSKPVKQEVNGTVIPPPLVFPASEKREKCSSQHLLSYWTRECIGHLNCSQFE
jgi:hypothetical protein